MTYRQVKWWMFGLPLILFFILWMFLYIPYLRTNPKWFIEETSALHAAINTANGQPVYFATWNTYFHPVAPFQPGYLWITGLFARGDILGARFFNALLALGIACMIYVWGKRSFSMASAFAASMLFLVYEQSIICFREVHSYNGVAFGALLAGLFLTRHARPKNDLIAGIGIMIAAASHPTFIYVALAALLVRFQKPKSLIFLFAPTIIYLVILIVWIYSKFGHWVFEDIKTLLLWYRGSCISNIGDLFKNIFNFFTQDWMHIGAVIGFLCCFPRKLYKFGLFAAMLSLLLLKERVDTTTYYHHAIILLPLMCLCWGAIIVRINHLFRNVYQYNLMLFVVLLIVAFCIGKVLIPLLEGNFKQYNDISSSQSIENLEATAEWVNAHTKPDDLVIANPNIGWLLTCQNARYRQSVAWDGITTLGYERPINRERFRYDASLERAKFVVAGYEDFHWDPSWRNLQKLFERMQSERWILVWKSSFYSIYANPRYLQ